MITLLALSVNRQVEQDEYAVQYYVHTKSFGPLLEQGKHTTKVDTKFFIFPRTVYDLGIPTITCLSSDKIEIDLTVDVQAALRPGDEAWGICFFGRGCAAKPRVVTISAPLRPAPLLRSADGGVHRQGQKLSRVRYYSSTVACRCFHLNKDYYLIGCHLFNKDYCYSFK